MVKGGWGFLGEDRHFTSPLTFGPQLCEAYSLPVLWSLWQWLLQITSPTRQGPYPLSWNMGWMPQWGTGLRRALSDSQATKYHCTGDWIWGLLYRKHMLCHSSLQSFKPFVAPCVGFMHAIFDMHMCLVYNTASNVLPTLGALQQPLRPKQLSGTASTCLLENSKDTQGSPSILASFSAMDSDNNLLLLLSSHHS